ncbi:glycoside hydrolase family 3 N-terminal domain-containing protein [Haploplasma axanthum]|nr:glycoside hydrolase family 3 N-terminal domain-containing protein [Haploplasma axanthum]
MNLTIEQKVGQIMIIGWLSDNVEDIIELIKTYHFGNIILFTRNIKSANDLKIMTERIQEAALKYNGVKAFIAIDQEGGNVRRIYDGVTNVPGHMSIGAASYNKPDAALQIGQILGEELNYLGVNFNLAPIADINSNPYNPVIGIRAFSDDPYLVSKLASDYAKGLESKGVLSSYKHFIGHGNVSVDSHLDLPHLDTSIEELKKNELIPYLNQKYHPGAIMTAHILYTKIDDRFPATLSKKIIEGLLRKDIGYQGMVVSDCFEMDAISRAFSLQEAGVFAVKAGVDMIMVSHRFGRQLSVRNGIIKALNDGVISEEELDLRVNSVLRTKEKYIKDQVQNVDFNKNKEVANAISLSSVTLVSGKPFEIDSETIIVGVTNYLNSIAEDKNVENMDIAKIIGEEFGIPYHSIDNKNFNVNEIGSIVKNKKVILALSDSHLTLVQKVLYSQLIHKQEKLMLISLRTPYDVLGQDLPDCHLAIYEYTKQSISSLIKVLKGAKALGRSPVILENRSIDDESIEISNQLVRKAIYYIEENYAKQISLGEVADELKVSREHLSRIIKSETGTNFNDYLVNTRIRHAKHFLGSTSLRVYEIGHLCGFTDANYFSKKFKKVVGLTPYEYRNNFK